ncbi:MAG: phosphoenolpyruvate--protein phosphotransferase [Treponema sp.]
MIGIVLVSHSFELANGAEVLSRAMAGPEVRIAAAGGLDTPDKAVGTDPMRILEAIEQVYSDDGVLIFADMGSALLSADFAIQMLEEDKQPHVIISDAPFIEGAVCAAVQARLNTPLPLILQELKTALLPKQEQLGTAGTEVQDDQTAAKGQTAEVKKPQEAGTAADSSGTRTKLSFTVTNTYGIHARPAARIAALAGTYPHLTVTVQKQDSGKPAVSALSLNSIALLGIRQGDGILFSVTGEDTGVFCAELTALAAARFGDTEESDSVSSEGGSAASAVSETPVASVNRMGLNQAEPHKRLTAAQPSELSGLIGSAGQAEGAARFLQRQTISVENSAAEMPETEWNRFLEAAAKVKAELKTAAVSVQSGADSNAAAIFEAHILILEDPVITEAIHKGIYTDKFSAASAWQTAMQSLQQSYRESGSPYLQERVSDIEDIEYLLLQKLLRLPETCSLTGEGIVIAEDLTPRQTALLDTALVKGICTVKGSPTSHTAILARSLGIPALMGIDKAVLSIPESTPLLLDADNGVLYINPAEALCIEHRKHIELNKEADRAAAERRYQPAVTGSGKTILVAANIGSAAEARVAVKNGADGVGLLRTEFLFLSRKEAPSEEEQYRAYCEIAQILDGRPLIIRTLDAGGDKEIPYLNLPKDDNPFLGYRAIRISLAEKNLFRTQLRAIIRAAQIYPVRIMFPMISSIEELAAAKKELAIAQKELEQQYRTVLKPLPTGMMMEIPSAALQAEQFVQEVDFFSIGTNDLTQYTLAAERGNSRVAHLYSASNPAVLQLIKTIVAAARHAGKSVGVCGEFASEAEGAQILCGLGIDELSVSAPLIPKIKDIIRSL